MSIRFVNTSEFDQIVKNNKYVVANFTATWCGPCQAIKPIVDEIYGDKDFQKIEIVRVDLDSQRELAERYEVTAVPTFVFIENGATVEVVKGASPKMKTAFESLRQKAENDTEVSGRWVAESAKVVDTSEIDQLIPPGFSIVPVSREVEALNAEITGSVRDLFDISKPGSIQSDADSQMIIYAPLSHISKVYSILIKCTSTVEDGQYPEKIKIWTNKTNILSFDDIDNVATHSEAIEASKFTNGWYECKVKYVRFQNVQSLNIFFDGEDEDNHTVVDKLVLVGITGEENTNNIVDKLTSEE